MRALGDMQRTTEVIRVADLAKSEVAPRQGSISAAIAASWRRCLMDYSLDRAARHTPQIIDASELNALRAQHEDLIRIATAEIDWLYDRIPDSGHTLVLTDASGLVLYEKAHSTLRDAFHRAGLRPGADWSERHEGTNGIGTCIAEDGAVIVHRDAHYRLCHAGLTCFGSPIHDPGGTLLAVLDASTLHAADDGASLAHTLALLNDSAQRIEQYLFQARFRHDVQIHLHPRAELLELHHGGTLALASDASVIGVDETAMRLLGLHHRGELIGRRLETLFDLRTEDLLELASDTPPLPQVVHDAQGRRFHVSVSAGGAGHAVEARRAADRASADAIMAMPLVQVAPTGRRNARLSLEDVAGEDPQMLRNVRSARRIATSRVPVMIQGPTGAGKEVFARALHAASDRASQPFVAINCAAIPETLIESELFGYRSGAFTGARKEGMKGKILQSSGGTLFLDEIGDMPLSLQTRLLRVLEEQEVVPLGTETPLKVDLRVICASHQNLRAMIARGAFREDLYYRLNGITLELPPLAQRADKERLVREFFAAETSDGRPAAIEMDAFRRMLDYEWPGNIRELRNVIRTALAICDGGVVRLGDLPSELRQSAGLDPAASSTQPRARSSVDRGAAREALLCALRECNGNMSHTARRLGIGRNTLYRRCRAFGIELRDVHEKSRI